MRRALWENSSFKKAAGNRQRATVGAQHAAPSRLSPHASRLIRSARVAHLATADKSGQPHVIPICFAFDGNYFYSPIDEKPKRVSPRQLRRVRNIEANPKVSLVIDHYEEDWRKLAFLIVFGTARILLRGERHLQAVKLLRKKYFQYRRMAIDERPMIVVTAKQMALWSAR